MRIQHGDKIITGRRPPSKKSKGKRAGSEDSQFDEAETAGGTNNNNAEEPAVAGEDDPNHPINVITTEETMAFDKHPELSQEFVGYIIGKAKYGYLIREHEELGHELEALQAREDELRMECEELLKGILRKEIG